MSHAPQAIFSLDQARQLLPRVKHVTADAVRRTESLAAQLHGLTEEDPDHETLSAALRDVVDAWAAEVQLLGPRARGVWLVDFDNGQGYYCWAYPELAITHYHAYGDALDVRLKIH